VDMVTPFCGWVYVCGNRSTSGIAFIFGEYV
jgi:hypothetical protein